MEIFTASRVREIDAFTIKNEPILSIDLMERAAQAFTEWFVINAGISQSVKIFAGPGNNGGDALAIARLLLDRNYNIQVYLLAFSPNLSNDCRTNLERLRQFSTNNVTTLDEKTSIPEITRSDIIIDGIFGSGLSRPVDGFPAEVIRHINKSGAKVIAIDIPSGLFGEDNRQNNPENIIKADTTLSFQFPFLSFLFADNEKYTGRWEILDIGLHQDAIKQTETSCHTLEASDIKKILKPRSKFSHKGTFGHALLISGSYGMMGAAVLGAKACLRGGAGLVTAHVPKLGYDIIQGAVPEAITSIDESDSLFTGLPSLSPFNAVGIGPGLKCTEKSGKCLERLLREIKVPLVMDADALNMLSGNQELYSLLPEYTILTPHPGEFDRLTGSSTSMFERYQKQINFSSRYHVIVALKGAHTIITTPEGITWFNTTGNPGMATGGSGDVLTGLIVSLLAQGYTPLEASKTAVFLHGLAGDLAKKVLGEESLIASDLIDYLGNAFLKIKEPE